MKLRMEAEMATKLKVGGVNPMASAGPGASPMASVGPRAPAMVSHNAVSSGGYMPSPMLSTNGVHPAMMSGNGAAGGQYGGSPPNAQEPWPQVVSNGRTWSHDPMASQRCQHPHPAQPPQQVQPPPQSQSDWLPQLQKTFWSRAASIVGSEDEWKQVRRALGF